MPASTIAQILIRIFALTWILEGLLQFAAVVGFRQPTALGWTLAPAIVYLIAGIVAWFAASLVSRILVGKNDGEVNLSGVTTEQLFSTAFLALGVYFALDSFAAVFSWGHFFAVSRSPDYGFHQQTGPSYYDLTEAVMTFAAGVGLVCTSRIWARKLSRGMAAESIPASLEESQEG